MPLLSNYRAFDGRSWEMGSLQNYLAATGVIAPHTGQPYSEALLMGLSGGLLMGYFSFDYTGDPHVAILTRNTFDPFKTVVARLGMIQHLRQTTDPVRASRYLNETIEDGLPAIVLADAVSLPYNRIAIDGEFWLMAPVIVYGYEEGGQAWIADRSAVPHTVAADVLLAARGRVKKDRFKLLTLEPPEAAALPGAIRQGILDCLQRSVESPVKQARANFGFNGFDRWATMLTHPTDKQSWQRRFPAGERLYRALTSAYRRAELGAAAAADDRALYADFLDEADVVLDHGALRAVAERFRASAAAWSDLAAALLPGTLPALARTRALVDERRVRFVAEGAAASPRLREIDAELAAIRTASADTLSVEQGRDLRARIADQVQAVATIERGAFDALRTAMIR